MTDDLYQEIILDHYKNPRGASSIERPLADSHQVNPTCGDEVTVWVGSDSEGNLDIAYQGQGCSISQASASVMSELLEGKSPAQAQEIQDAFMELMQSKGLIEPNEEILEDAVAFQGVSRYPARIKCALISWMALADAQIKAGMRNGER